MKRLFYSLAILIFAGRAHGQQAPPPMQPPAEILAPDTDLPGDSSSRTGFVGPRTSVFRGSNEALLIPTKIKVTGSDSFMRATFLSAAQELKRKFSNTLGIQHNEWQLPIVIELIGDPADIISGRDLATKVEIVPGTIRLLLFVKLHENMTEKAFAREMLRILVLHEMLLPYRNKPAQIPGRLEVPDWLLTGMIEHLHFVETQTRSPYFRGIIESGDIMSVDEILRLKNHHDLDPISRRIFEASSAALVKILLDQEKTGELRVNAQGRTEGKRTHLSFRAMLNSFATATESETADPASILKQHFAALRENTNSIDKWWALQIASMSEKSAFDFHSIKETQSLLDDLMKVVFEPDHDPENSPQPAQKKGVLNKIRSRIGGKTKQPAPEAETFLIEEYKDFMKRDDLRRALARNALLAKEVQLRGFPVYVELATQIDILYSKILADSPGINSGIKQVKELRAKIDAALERITDYMNHYEATEAPVTGGLFEDYSEARKSMEREPRPPRNDRITRYLDDLEKEFE